ncbi:MAG: PBSX family phage terminase large subunit [Bacillota bacterium]|jgi:PBSX family phage terminase large subunit
MIKTKTIPWKPLGPKHKAYIKNALDNRMCVAEGAIRSGKTIDHCIIAAMYLEICPDRIHLASGSTVANAKLNIGDCNGYGLEYLFRGRCRWGKYKDNEALFVNTQTGEKVVIFSGGGKADSYKRILGNSYGLWIATEINEHYDCDDSRISFIKVAMGRQAAAQRPFTLWDLNPCHPGHEIYTSYIDKYKEGFLGGYLYEHFTMRDNLSISDERRREIESQYDMGSVWHARDILGERRIAEGLIYQQFADNPDEYMIDLKDDNNADWLKDVMFVSIGIDVGGSRAKTAFVANAIHARLDKITTIYDHSIGGKKGEVDADRVCNEFIGFVERIQKQYPHLYIKYTFVDSEAQYIKNSIKNAVRNRGWNIDVADSRKQKIKDRIFAGNTLLNVGRLFIGTGCKLVQGGLSAAAWDNKKPDERLDNFSTDIDILDAWEYSWEYWIRELCPTVKGVMS